MKDLQLFSAVISHQSQILLHSFLKYPTEFLIVCSVPCERPSMRFSRYPLYYRARNLKSFNKFWSVTYHDSKLNNHFPFKLCYYWSFMRRHLSINVTSPKTIPLFPNRYKAETGSLPYFPALRHFGAIYLFFYYCFYGGISCQGV